MADFMDIMKEMQEFTDGLYACDKAGEAFKNIHTQGAFFSAIATIIDQWCADNEVSVEESNERIKEMVVARKMVNDDLGVMQKRFVSAE